MPLKQDSAITVTSAGPFFAPLRIARLGKPLSRFSIYSLIARLTTIWAPLGPAIAWFGQLVPVVGPLGQAKTPLFFMYGIMTGTQLEYPHCWKSGVLNSLPAPLPNGQEGRPSS